MSNFIGRPPFSNSLWVGIETMQFHIAQTKFFLRTPSFPIQGVPMNNLAPMKNCPRGGVQGNLNWMPGYKRFIFGTLIVSGRNGNKGFVLLLRLWSQMSRSNGSMS